MHRPCFTASPGHRPVRPLVLAAALVVAASCQDCDPIGLTGEDPEPPPPAPACTLTPPPSCGNNESFRDGRCQNTYCELDSECCPGTRCDTTFNLCRSRLLDTECDVDEDCPVRGQRCQESASGKVCALAPCAKDEECRLLDNAYACFQGRCVGANPCPGGCPVGQVCDVVTASCHDSAGHPGCDEPCELGTLRVLKAPALMSGAICCGWECLCAPLPPLAPGVFGHYASVAVSHLEVAVASYDITYGDLVVSRFSRTGLLTSVEYVDGYPATGTMGGAVNGPRGGVVEPGPDVGRWASVAVDAQARLHVASHDKTAGALRYARNVGPGMWTTHVVDDTGEAGQFASLSIRPASGAPVVAYLATGLADAQGRPASAVKVALARTADPTSSADWEIQVVEQAATHDACGHACNPQSTCVLRGPPDGGTATPACRATTTGCAPACGAGQACVQEGTTPTCLALGNPPVDGMPRVLGLHTSLAVRPDGSVVVAYQDGTRGWLKGAVLLDNGVTAPVVVDGDGQGSRVAGEVGAFVSVAVDPLGKVGMAYEDRTHHALRFYHGAGLSSGTFSVVDDGVGSPPGVSVLGAGASLAFGADGTAYVAYQEQGFMDLRVAQRDPDGTWTVTVPLDQGPYGFYTDLAVSSGMAFIPSVRPALDARQEVADRLGLLIVTVPFP